MNVESCCITGHRQMCIDLMSSHLISTTSRRLPAAQAMPRTQSYSLVREDEKLHMVICKSRTSKSVEMTGMMLWNTNASDNTGSVLGTAVMSAFRRACGSTPGAAVPNKPCTLPSLGKVKQGEQLFVSLRIQCKLGHSELKTLMSRGIKLYIG